VSGGAGGPPDESGKGRERGQGAGFAGLVLIVVLVLAGYFLVRKLAAVSELQDCIMSGRTNCAPITPAGN
jgi:hypothetical protein